MVKWDDEENMQEHVRLNENLNHEIALSLPSVLTDERGRC